MGATELDVDLHPVARALFLVALPSLCAALVALVRGQPAEPEAVQDPPHPRRGDLDVVVALEMHRDACGAEVVVLAQTHDPLDHLALGRGGAVMGPRAAVTQPLGGQLVESVAPLVEEGAADALVAARRCDVAGDLLGVAKHRQAVPDLALLLSVVHQDFLSRESSSVNNLRQF